MNRLDEIKQATTPIYQFKGVGEQINTYVSGEDAIYSQNTKHMYPEFFPVKDMQLSRTNDSGHGLNDMIHILNMFNNANPDNPYAINPIEPDGTYIKQSFIPRAYDINLALSNWDEIKSKYGEAINKKSNELSSQAYGLYSGQSYAGAALVLGSGAYLAENAGASSEHINKMIELVDSKDGYVNENNLKDMRTVITSNLTDNTKTEILNTATPNMMSFIAHTLNSDNSETIMPNAYTTVMHSKDINIAKEILDDISDGYLNLDEAKDCVNAMNLMTEHLDKHNQAHNVLLDIYEDVRGIRYYEENDMQARIENDKSFKPTSDQINGIVFGDNKLTNLMQAYINNMHDTIDYTKTLYQFKDKPMEDYSDKTYSDKTDLNNKKYESIVIPLGLVSGPYESQYGKYDIIKVPVDNTFGKMTVSDDFVNKNNKTAELSFLVDSSKTVKFYDKNTKETVDKKFNISELKDIYNKNWEKLKSRNQNLDAKFDLSNNNISSLELN